MRVLVGWDGILYNIKPGKGREMVQEQHYLIAFGLEMDLHRYKSGSTLDQSSYSLAPKYRVGNV